MKRDTVFVEFIIKIHTKHFCLLQFFKQEPEMFCVTQILVLTTETYCLALISLQYAETQSIDQI
jgi:hypothetical protein